MKPLHQVLIAAVLLLIAAGTWWLLTRPKAQANWLRVEAPPRIAPGETVTVRITPIGLGENLLLNVDFHGTTHRHRPLRVVGHGQAQRIGRSGQVLDFRLTVAVRSDVASVHAIIYASPTGGWPDRVLVAKSEPIPIEASGASDGQLQPLRAHDHLADAETPRVELHGLRWLLVALWLVVTGVLLARLKRPPDATRRGSALALIAACLAVMLNEVFLLEPVASNAARQIALKYGLYDQRLLPQQIALVGAVVIVAALATFILLKARNRRLVLGLLAHAAIATIAILSLHGIDALLYTTIGGAPVEQLAKLAAVFLSLSGLRLVVSAPAADSG